MEPQHAQGTRTQTAVTAGLGVPHTVSVPRGQLPPALTTSSEALMPGEAAPFPRTPHPSSPQCVGILSSEGTLLWSRDSTMT